MYWYILYVGKRQKKQQKKKKKMQKRLENLNIFIEKFSVS